MNGEDRRGSRRLGVRLPVLIRSGPVSEHCETADVAHRGIFVVVDRARPEKSLVSLTIKLPSGGLNVHGMVARVVSAAEAETLGVPAGMGIQFYGLGTKARERWEAFITGEGGGAPEADQPGGLEAPRTEPDAAPAGSTGEGDGSSKSRPEVLLRPTPKLRLAVPGPGGKAPEPRGVVVRPALVIIDPSSDEEPARGVRRPARPARGHERLERREDHDTEQSLATVDEALEDEPPTIAEPPSRPSAPLRRRPTGADGRGPAAPPDEPDDEEPPTTARDQAPPGAPPKKGPPARAAFGIGLAPSGPVGSAVYRLAIPSVEELEGFGETALRSGGVFVRTRDVRPSGTPAVVSVVHPLSGDEFHLPGQIVPTPGDRPGVAVGFARVTERTIADFRTFVALGIPDLDLPPRATDWNELTITDRAADRTSDIAASGPGENTHEVDISDLMPFEKG